MRKPAVIATRIVHRSDFRALRARKTDLRAKSAAKSGLRAPSPTVGAEDPEKDRGLFAVPGNIASSSPHGANEPIRSGMAQAICCSGQWEGVLANGLSGTPELKLGA